ncbi:MAG TPA: hypothetical protein VD997_05625 [Phycisphaerales bacterium]|nr:hypothetical protein [Phycisphaerales bacterium]
MQIRSIGGALALTSVLSLAGCQQPRATSYKPEQERVHEVRIHTLGNQSVITFQAPPDPGDGAPINAPDVSQQPHALLPVSGVVPVGAKDVNLTVHVTGLPRNLSPTHFWFVEAKDPRSNDLNAPRPRQVAVNPRPVTFAAEVAAQRQQQECGVVQLSASETDKIREERAKVRPISGLSVAIDGAYLAGAADGDRITVQIDYEGTFEEPVAKRETTFQGSVARTFVLYKVDTFRKDREYTVPVYNIAAMPIPYDETDKLFGSKIANHYYVVRLSFRNTTNTDWLISTGMIRASGRAMVVPVDGANSPRFSIPIMVSPQAREHVYAILERQEFSTFRSWSFRGLEFVGSLSTALANGLSWGDDAIRGIGIFTGVGVPELGKLWVDHFPGYKRNVVNYAMPAYLKVPRTSTSMASFIFFSKDDLESMVMDSNLFGDTSKEAEFSFGDKRSTQKTATPRSYVIGLEFDGLDIPYEIVILPDEVIAGAEGRITSAGARAKEADDASLSFARTTGAFNDATTLVGSFSDPALAEFKSAYDALFDELSEQRRAAASSFTLTRDSASAELAKANRLLTEKAEAQAVAVLARIKALHTLVGPYGKLKAKTDLTGDKKVKQAEHLKAAEDAAKALKDLKTPGDKAIKDADTLAATINDFLKT